MFKAIEAYFAAEDLMQAWCIWLQVSNKLVLSTHDQHLKAFKTTQTHLASLVHIFMLKSKALPAIKTLPTSLVQALNFKSWTWIHSIWWASQPSDRATQQNVNQCSFALHADQESCTIRTYNHFWFFCINVQKKRKTSGKLSHFKGTVCNAKDNCHWQTPLSRYEGFSDCKMNWGPKNQHTDSHYMKLDQCKPRCPSLWVCNYGSVKNFRQRTWKPPSQCCIAIETRTQLQHWDQVACKHVVQQLKLWIYHVHTSKSPEFKVQPHLYCSMQS